MDYELSQVQALIVKTNIQDFSISDIQTTEVQVDGQQIHGLLVEVLLNTQTGIN